MFYVLKYDALKGWQVLDGKGMESREAAEAKYRELHAAGFAVKIVKECSPLHIPESANFGQADDDV